MTMWNKERVLQLLDTNDRAVERAILVIYSRQTRDEQASSETCHRNGVGFSGAHANFGSYLAKYLLADQKRRLTGKFLMQARDMSKHYVGQLLDEIQAKELSHQ